MRRGAHGGSDRDAAVSLRFAAKVHRVAEGLPMPTIGDPVTMGMETVVCLSGPGAATVTGVDPEGATANFSLDGFAVRENGMLTAAGEMLGQARGTLADAGLSAGPGEVSSACQGDSGAGSEIGIQMTRTGPAPATVHGFTVHWRTGDKAGELYVPLAVVLCDGPTAAVERCDTGPLLH
jgi:hypothetical protein